MLVDCEDHAIVHQDRRSAGPINVVEGANRHLPEGLPISVIGNETEVAKEDHDRVAVRDGGSGSWSIARIERFGAWPRGHPTPDLSPRGAVQSDGYEILIVDTGEVDAIANQNGGGVSWRNSGFPGDVGLRAKLSGKVGGVEDTLAVVAAEHCPVRAA